MRLRREPAIQIKAPAQIGRMHAAGLVVARTLAMLADAVRPGITTATSTRSRSGRSAAAGAVPSFLGYFGYPATICSSVNEQVVHGIPSEGQRLRAGDIISIDCGAILDGWHGDAAISLGVGRSTRPTRRCSMPARARCGRASRRRFPGGGWVTSRMPWSARCAPRASTA